MDELHFIYRNANGEKSKPHLVNWREHGKYIEGYNREKEKVQTYLKYRVVKYLNGSDKALRMPHVAPPPKARDASPPEICFTGFERKKERPRLEKQAAKAGMKVRSSVTQNLTYLCTGPNAGPAKVAEAKTHTGLYILSEFDFQTLIDTGEVPEP